MPLNAPEPPEDYSDAVRRQISAFAENRQFRTRGLREARADTLTVADAHRVFNLGLDDLRAGAGLTAAQPVGWRYLIRDGDRAVASAESIPDPDRGTPVFASFNEGPFVSATATALAVAAIDRRVADRQFSPRLLQVPALNAIAVWLHPDDAGDDDEDDLLIPLAPFPLNVQNGVPIAAPALLSALAELAAVIPEDPDNQQGA